MRLLQAVIRAVVIAAYRHRLNRAWLECGDRLCIYLDRERQQW